MVQRSQNGHGPHILSRHGQDGLHRYAILIVNDVNKSLMVWDITAVDLIAIVVGVVVRLLANGSFGVATSTGLINIFPIASVEYLGT